MAFPILVTNLQDCPRFRAFQLYFLQSNIGSGTPFTEYKYQFEHEIALDQLLHYFQTHQHKNENP